MTRTNEKNIKEKIIDALENKITHELSSEYIDKEDELLRALSKLESFGGECKCNQDNVINVINEDGDCPEINGYCLDCGGYIEH